MADADCSIEGCSRTAHARGWCTTHYARWRRDGDPGGSVLVQQHHASPEDSFAARTRSDGDCIVWVGARNSMGYGQIWVNGVRVLAHRYAWESVNGPIPAGMVIDHLCHNVSCVEPRHLRAVAQVVNSNNRDRANLNSGTGIRNVHAHRGMFVVRIMANRKVHRFGTYSTLEEAEAVAIEKREEIFGRPPAAA